MTEMWAHQKEGVRRALEKECFGWLYDAGTGKTRTAIETLRQIFTREGRLLSTLILCPQVVIENWRQEILKYSKIPLNRIHKLQGTGKKRIEMLQVEGAKGACIFITNYEALTMKLLFEELLKQNFEVLICDESHRLKNPEAKRTRAAIQIADQAHYRYILSGTPILRNLMDIWSQFRVLDKGEAFGKNFFVFRSQYFYDRNAHMPAHIKFPNWQVRPNHEALISQMMGEKTMSVRKDECLDLPPLVRKKIFVELEGEQKRTYEEMKKNFVAFINSEAAIAELALTKALRLQQIVSGFVKTEPSITSPEPKIHRFETNPRVEALHELLEDLAPNHKVIVWACFKENYAMIREVCEKLELKYVELHGEVSSSSRDEAIRQFEEDFDTRVVIGNQGAGGIGVNLIAASYAIYYSRNFSLEHDIQSEARNYRGGSERHESITRIDLVAQGTIDEEVLEALANKQAIGETLLREIAGRLK